MERRGEAEGQTGEKYGWDWKFARESKPEAAALGWWPGWLREGLKGDGLFANCGHFWPEHDKFNDYFNALLSTTETWSAIAREASVLEICFQTLQGSEECSFMVQVQGQAALSVCASCKWLLAPTFISQVLRPDGLKYGSSDCYISALTSDNAELEERPYFTEGKH